MKFRVLVSIIPNVIVLHFDINMFNVLIKTSLSLNIQSLAFGAAPKDADDPLDDEIPF